MSYVLWQKQTGSWEGDFLLASYHVTISNYLVFLSNYLLSAPSTSEVRVSSREGEPIAMPRDSSVSGPVEAQ